MHEADEPPPYHLFGKLQPITRRWIKDYVQLKSETTIGMVAYEEIKTKAAELIYAAITRHAGDRGEPVIKAMLDPYNPTGSTDHVAFITSKTTLWKTSADKCHINYVVCDSDWEAEFARVVETHPATLSYVKNQALGFEVPWRDGATPRRYLPDFIVRLDDGRGADDPLNLIVEIKGQKDLASQLKAETMRAFWVPGVNNLKTFGRWQFVEFSDVWDIEKAFSELIRSVANRKTELEIA
jgi:type III restriction enzyme